MMVQGVMPAHSSSTMTIIPLGMLWTAIALAFGAVGGSGLGSGAVAQPASKTAAASLIRDVVIFVAPLGDGSQVVIIRQGVERQACIPQAALAVGTAQAKHGAATE
jgi:hypothetical protein